MTHVLAQKPAQLWRDYPRETLFVGLLGFVASAAFAGVSYNVPPAAGPGITESAAKVAPPAPPPLQVQVLVRFATGLRLRVAGLRGQPMELQFSRDLLNWSTIATHSGGSALFDKDVEMDQSRGFFRVRISP